MSKQNKPYYLDMRIDLKKIENLPPDTNAGKIFTQVIIGSVVKVSKQTNGINMGDQRRLYSLRNAMENAVAVGEISNVEISYEDFKFLKRMWEAQQSEATVNELIMICEEKIIEAENRHDRPETLPEMQEKTLSVKLRTLQDSDSLPEAI